MYLSSSYQKNDRFLKGTSIEKKIEKRAVVKL